MVMVWWLEGVLAEYALQARLSDAAIYLIDSGKMRLSDVLATT